MRRGLWIALLMAGMLAISAPGGTDDPYLVERIVQPDGRVLEVVVVPGRPPEVKMPVAVLPKSDPSKGVVILSGVPAFGWSYGCSATTAAMMAGYYDRHGYPNMYSGPQNGGLCPLTNTVWDAGGGECPLSATHQGFDGLAVRGHVDDYYSSYGAATDPYIDGVWTEHTHADCTGDYMKTSQWGHGYENTDGTTRFYYWGDNTPFSSDMDRDGGSGLADFFESRGYTVTDWFNQYIFGWSGVQAGFTFDQYKAEIDAGRPVMIHITGHTMLGFGYDDSTNLVYLHDTWDYSSHTMVWGGTYDSKAHRSVTVVRLEPGAWSEDIFDDGFESGDTSSWSSSVP